MAYNDIGDNRKAYDMIQEAYYMQKSILGETDIDTLKSMKELGVIVNQLGYHQEAVNILENCYDMFKKYYGKDHNETISVYSQRILSPYKNRNSSLSEGFHLHYWFPKLQKSYIRPTYIPA